MLSKNELRYTLALQRVPNLGDASAKKLIHHVGSAEGVFSEDPHKLLKIDGIGASKLKALNDRSVIDEAESELRFVEQNEIAYSYYQDVTYPERLKHCLDGPLLFFHKGNIDLKNKRIISIVGTRSITTYGKAFCEKLIAELVPLDPVIVSGFAYGVDITAHKAALKHGLQTIACLAHGLNQIYPRSHKNYVEKVKDHGGLITEFWSDDPFDRTNFLRRNRIIAGISEATVVIESGEKGGSLVTADIANSYNREVFAVPGRATDLQSVGCNYLIRTQQAHLITSSSDLVFMLGWKLKPTRSPVVQTRLFDDLSEAEQKIVDYLQQRDKELLDSIALGCGIPAFAAASLLLTLELKGVVQPLPGKQFKLV